MSTASELQHIRCTACKTGLKVKPKYIGKRVTCPKCHIKFEAVPRKKRSSKSTEENQEKKELPNETPAEKRTAGKISKRKKPANPQPNLAVAAPAEQLKRKKVTANKTPDTPPGMIRCKMCHEFIPKPDFAEHKKSHKGTREDGRLKKNPTLPPENQFKGELSNVPQKYVHETCGNKTRMPEEMIRTYLVNPYFYGYKTYCSGCKRYVAAEELKWESTGESLMDYTRKLQEKIPGAAKYWTQFLKNWIGTSLTVGILIGLLIGALTYFVSGPSSAITIFFAFALVASMGMAFALVTKRGGI